MTLKRSNIRRGTSTLKRAEPLKSKGVARKATAGKTPANSAGALRLHAGKRERQSKAKKSRGLKGRVPTAAEQRFMDAVATLGCRACAKDGIENSHISLHHIDGRTKEGAHFKVLPLCAPHHQQDDSDPAGRLSVHGAKARFEARYGTQAELLAECVALIKSKGAGSYELAAPSIKIL